MEPDDAPDPSEVDAVSVVDDVEPGSDEALDVDLQAVLDEEPCYPRKPGPKPKYKPGTRLEPASRETAAAEGSWWVRPGADFAKEAQRMRDQPTKLKVPGEHHVIGWGAAF